MGLAEDSRKSRSDGLGGTTEIPTLVEALQHYLSSSSYTTESTTALTTKFPFGMSSLDIIDMNSLLRTVDVRPTVDRYGYVLEEPPYNKPTTAYDGPFDFSIMTKIPFLLRPTSKPLAVNNFRYNDAVQKHGRETPLLVESIVKLRTVATPTADNSDKTISKKSANTLKNFNASSLKEMTENDLLTLWNVVRKYHVADKLPCNGIRQIYDTVDNIRQGKLGRSSSGIVNGMNCNFNGSWLSTVAGMRIDLNQTDDRTFSVSLASKVPPPKGGLLYTENCTDWLLSARLAMKKTSILQLTGVNEKEKKLAVFLGECRVCNDKSLVYGHWMVLRESRDCEDIFSTQETYSDVWRSEGLHTLRLHNLQMLKMSLTTTEKQTAAPDAVTTVNGTTMEGNVANHTVTGVTGGTGGNTAVTSIAPTVTSVGGNTAVSEGAAATVVTGVVPPEGTALDVASTAATNAVNIVVGKKRIAIKL